MTEFCGPFGWRSVPPRCPPVEALLRAVRPSKWRGSKVSGIDLASDFVWIDDDPRHNEIDDLRSLGLLDRLLIVDSDDGLLRAVAAITSAQIDGLG